MQEYDHLWREFARGDRNVKTPPRLRHGVMAEWDAAHHGRGQAPRRAPARRLALGAATVALLMVIAAVTMREPGSRAPSQLADTIAAAPDAMTREAPVVHLVADPVFENEPLTLVRVRLPRTSLHAIGIALDDADASGLVDMDVVVGSDGLARAIQQIRPAMDARFD
jgi:hypothetical protein